MSTYQYYWNLPASNANGLPRTKARTILICSVDKKLIFGSEKWFAWVLELCDNNPEMVTKYVNIASDVYRKDEKAKKRTITLNLRNANAILAA